MRRLLVSIVLAASSPAFARSEKTLAYERTPAFSTAVRFIRVDERLKMIEKDGDAGYVLFEIKEDKKTYRGSLEVIDVVKDGRHQTRFVIQIEDRPSWMEIEMLTRLERKLHVELGTPAPVASPKKEPVEPPKDKEPAKPEPPKDEGPRLSPTP